MSSCRTNNCFLLFAILTTYLSGIAGRAYCQNDDGWKRCELLKIFLESEPAASVFYLCNISSDTVFVYDKI